MNVKRSLLRLVVFLFSLVLTVVVTFYSARWLGEDIKITYEEINSTEAKIGESELANIMIAEITRLEYQEKAYESIRMIDYVLANNDSRSVKETQQFYFFGMVGEEILRIDSDAVIDIVSTHHMFDYNRDSGIAPSFTIVAGFEGKSEIPVTLVLNVKDYPHLSDMKIIVEPGPGQIDFAVKKPPRTYRLTFGTILLIVLISAASYSILWMIINVTVFKTHTAGARTFDWIFRKMGLPGFLPKEQKTKADHMEEKESN